jgi:predicted RNase H-like HicB family nuclease
MDTSEKHTIHITIEQSSDSYGAYSTNVTGIYGAGDTIGEVKQSIQDGIDSILEYDDEDQIPEELKGEYELEYHLELNQ